MNFLGELLSRVSDAARRGGASEYDLTALRLHVLERLKMETLQAATRVAHLERSMSAMEPDERRAAICERLGVSERRYYELRKLGSAIPGRTDTR